MKTKGQIVLNENTNLSLIKNYLDDFIVYLEKFPVQSNFYENLKKVDFKFVISSDMCISKNKNIMGIYNVKNNDITINVSDLKIVKSEKSMSKFWEYFYKTILHELTHMSSAKYNKKKKTHVSGFVISDKEFFYGALALTEGMTEVITHNYYEQKKIVSGYTIELLIVIQLMQIIGEDVLIESYFKNYGLEEIRRELERLDGSKENVDDLFAKLGVYFKERRSKSKKYGLAEVEYILTRYFIHTLETDMKKATSIDEIMDKIEVFKSSLITTEKLEKLKLRKEKYPNINVAIEELNKIQKIIKDEYRIIKVKRI